MQEVVLPQYVEGRKNVSQIPSAGPIKHWGWRRPYIRRSSTLLKRWPVIIDLFVTSLDFRIPAFFSLVADHLSLVMDEMLQQWDGLRVYAFPPFTLIQLVLHKLHCLLGVTLMLIPCFWQQKEWFPDLLELAVELLVFLP